MDLDARQQRLVRCERRQARRSADHALALALGVLLGCAAIAALAIAGLCLILGLPVFWAKVGCTLTIVNVLALTGVAAWDMGREIQYQRWVKQQG